MTREIRPATSSADKAKNVHLFSKLLCSSQIAHANFEDVLQQAFVRIATCAFVFATQIVKSLFLNLKFHFLSLLVIVQTTLSDLIRNAEDWLSHQENISVKCLPP